MSAAGNPASGAASTAKSAAGSLGGLFSKKKGH
jgi:hypothetical protein